MKLTGIEHFRGVERIASNQLAHIVDHVVHVLIGPKVQHYMFVIGRSREQNDAADVDFLSLNIDVSTLSPDV